MGVRKLNLAQRVRFQVEQVILDIYSLFFLTPYCHHKNGQQTSKPDIFGEGSPVGGIPDVSVISVVLPPYITSVKLILVQLTYNS